MLLLFAQVALAQTVAAESPGVSGSAILQMLLGLTLIVALLFAGAYLLRRLNGGRSFGPNGAMKVVGGLMLSPRERIVLIEVGESWLVVGIVPGQIKTLHTLPKGELPLPDNTVKPFGQWLKQMTERTHEEK
jgi:flagellar protein FliO/FliZ